MKILSAQQIREWDLYTIENEPISSLDLMERAAQKCTRWLLKNLPGPSSIKIFCGKGNNGGDGLAIARQLAEDGKNVDVYILEFGAPGTEDFQANLARLHEYNLPFHFMQNAGFFPAIEKDDIVIDALYGSGMNRPLAGLSAELVEHLNNSGANIISIDLPSGMFTDASSSSNTVVKAAATLTFQHPKLCFFIPENEVFFGIVEILDIGLHPEFLKDVAAKHCMSEMQHMKHLYRPRKKFSHKGTYGHTLVIAGERGKMGAAILCAKACIKSGAGLVTAMVPANEMPVIQTALPEVMAVSHTELVDINLARFSTIAIGPGLGTSQHVSDLLNAVTQVWQKPMVIDADALNILADHPEIFDRISPNSILTPHPKEFERLFGQTNNHFEKMDLAVKQAKQRQLYIIIKGANSFLACPNGERYFNGTGNPGMATAGSGDVLTGIIAGLLAQGYLPKDACLFGLYLHGLSADLAARMVSQESLTANEIIKYLGKAFLKVADTKN